MFQRILVPLDGSPRAESAIPVAARLAKASGGSVILLQIVPPAVSPGKFNVPEAYPIVGTDQELAEANEYLKKVAQMSELSGVTTEIHSQVGSVAPEIISATQALHADLVVMWSHGDTGFKRWALGSVAHKLAPHSPVPVLILRDGGPVPAASAEHPVRVLVPLDGSPLSESAVEPAAQLLAALAPAQQRAMQLMQVVDVQSSYGKFRSMADSYFDGQMRAEVKQQDEQYLAEVAKRFAGGELAQYNLAVTTTVAVDPDIAEAIVQTAEQAEGAGSDVIVMATHGNGGLHNWVLGSIAERVLHSTKRPLLIVHPARTAQKTSKETVAAA